MMKQLPKKAALLASLLTFSACSLLTVQQQPFEPLAVVVQRPAAPPPRVVLTPSSIQINEKIQFALNSAEILHASDSLLDELAKLLKDNPQIELIQVEGHTDKTGGLEHNRKLSQRRADSVKAAMVARGIEAKRLVAKGFGPDRAIADNETEDGREKNRRVEFNIVKQGDKKTLVQD